MRLSDLLNRQPPAPWVDGSKLPWSEPGFSSRMLREHLSQEHDRASRTFSRIDRHVTWINEAVLGGRPSRILDLGCGPGLYTTGLAKLGHTCVGIDFSPASIAYARAEAEREGVSCEYHVEDLREGNLGSGFQAVLLVFGELNTFSPAEAQGLLSAAHLALAPSGVLILEVHAEDSVRRMGENAPTWFSANRGLFSDQPHLCLRECQWDGSSRTSVERYFVIDVETANVETYISTTQAHSGAEYATLLRDAGFHRTEQHPSLEGTDVEAQSGLFVILAWKDAA